jgi:hypothetical protein
VGAVKKREMMTPVRQETRCFGKEVVVEGSQEDTLQMMVSDEETSYTMTSCEEEEKEGV